MSEPGRVPDAPFSEWLTFGLSLAAAADAEALAGFRRDLIVTAKPDTTLVTQVDQAIERVLRERIRAAYPDHGLVGEEYGTEAGAGAGAAGAGARWYIDPIDGTHNFVRGIPLFATLIAVEHAGALVVGVVSAPALGERWFATLGGGSWVVRGASAPHRIRVSAVDRIEDAQVLYGSATGIDASGRAPGFRDLLRDAWRERGFGDFWGYMLVAEGAAEAMLEVGPNAWDLAAPLLIVEEAGGRMTDLDGRSRADGGEALASNGRLHADVLARLRAPGRADAP